MKLFSLRSTLVCCVLVPSLLAIAGPAGASAPASVVTASEAGTAPATPIANPASAPGKGSATKKQQVARAQGRPSATAGKRAAAKPKQARRQPTANGAAENVAATAAPCYLPTAGRGRCEPQCLPYTRCRSGIDSCRTGHENGPVTWFRCEQARGNTSVEPAQGQVMVLGRNAHNMRTGHTLYVEKVEPRPDGRYALTLSHTNYDRRCSLETNMLADYDPKSQTIDVQSGKWEAWGRDLKVAGFIR